MNADIAAEALARKTYLSLVINDKLVDIEPNISKIQSAIEKATEATAEHFRKGLYAKLDEAISRAAHASEKNLLDWAWTILANAGGGDWTKESKDWQEAVVRWRDAYHKNLSSRRAAHASEQGAVREALAQVWVDHTNKVITLPHDTYAQVSNALYGSQRDAAMKSKL